MTTRCLVGRLLALFYTVSGPVVAFEYRSVGTMAAILYDGPSAKANKLSIVNRHYPFEIITRLGDWVKVRDPSGELAWIEGKVLIDKRMVMVTAPAADIRENAVESAPILFRVEKNVVLELVEPPVSSWARVRHRDGATGFIRVEQIWGI